jgi:alpha-L-rhamnosidase
MNSLNHYSYGSVMEFVYKNIAGIKPLKPDSGKLYLNQTLIPN